MSHYPVDDRLARVVDHVSGATCTRRVVKGVGTKLAWLRCEVLEYGDGQLVYINPVTQQAQALTADQVGDPLD